MFFILDVPVNEPVNPVNDPSDQLPVISRTPPLVTLLAAVLWLEAVALAGASVFLIFEVLVAPADSVTSAIALAVVVAIAAVWVAVIAINTVRGNAWTRGASIVVQVLFGAIAIGSFQGIGPRPDIGWLVLIPALVVLILMFTKPVLAHTNHRD